MIGLTVESCWMSPRVNEVHRKGTSRLAFVLNTGAAMWCRTTGVGYVGSIIGNVVSVGLRPLSVRPEPRTEGGNRLAAPMFADVVCFPEGHIVVQWSGNGPEGSMFSFSDGLPLHREWKRIEEIFEAWKVAQLPSGPRGVW